MKKLFLSFLCIILIGTSVNVSAATDNFQTVQTQQTVTKKDTVAQAELPEKEVKAKTGYSAYEIQELLDTNAEGEYNLTVVIPAGTYEMERSLYVYPNTTIKATGAKLVKQDKYGAMVEAKLRNDDGGYDGNSNITIDGGTWDSKPIIDLDAGTETFRFIHCNNITIKNATLCNVPVGSHLIVFAGVQNATVDNCKFYGYGTNWHTAKTPKEAIQLDTVHSITEVPTLQENEILNWDDLPCDNITITNSEFYNFSRGIGSHTAVAGRFHTNVVIQNNNFHDLSDSAIRMYNYKDSVVSKNTINNAVVGVLAYTYIEAKNMDNAYLTPNNKKVGTLPTNYNISITGNTIKNIKIQNKNWGDGIRIIGSKKRTIGGISITGNTISNTARYGIFTTYAPKVVISEKNIISSSKKSGILAEDSYKASITGNTLKNMGIRVSGSNNTTVSGNTIENAKEAGIYVYQAKDCIVGNSTKDYNTIKSPAIQGIYMTTACNGGTIQYNKITDAKSDGIGVYSSAKVTVKNNKISSKQHGININTKSKSANITGNIINAAKKSGIWLASNSKASTISNNTIKKYGTTGDFSAIYVYMSGGTNAKNTTKITNNNVSGTKNRTNNPGIKLSGAAYTLIQGNNINSAQGTGIYVFKSKKCTIMKNTVTTPKERGIYVTTSCNDTKVKSNTVIKAVGEPISVYGSPGSTVSGNKIKK